MNLGEIIGLILVGLIFEVFTHLFLLDNLDTKFYTPTSIYNESNMNWFGVITVYLLIFPFSFILGIGGFLRWLFTVGGDDNMLNEKLKDIIEEVLRKHVKEYQNSEVENDKNIARVIYTAIRESGLVCNSWKSLEEQELNIYNWTAMENDGYTRMESGVATNMFDAFVKATEHSPSYHKYIEIERVEKEDYTDAHKELLEWHKEWYKGGSEK